MGRGLLAKISLMKNKTQTSHLSLLEKHIFQIGFKIGFEQGYKKGYIDGKQRIIFIITRKLFGRIPQTAEKRIKKLSSDDLDALAIALLDFEKPSDLTAWLKANADVAAA